MSGERLQDHWSSGLTFLINLFKRPDTKNGSGLRNLMRMFGYPYSG